MILPFLESRFQFSIFLLIKKSTLISLRPKKIRFEFYLERTPILLSKVSLEKLKREKLKRKMLF
ncbi:hypothetical protein DLM75_04290 [Leptospira stimsonii]|uniref:Uncharacterized protein n=1 Tax=Leptospira stimsonii TaxID=2202203 RepID=A0A396ZFD1_9LEPT|nr:hypothetical protein DLM75_04290 [Leptospira stimsonii]